jgi:hypothetical protein
MIRLILAWLLAPSLRERERRYFASVAEENRRLRAMIETMGKTGGVA